MKSLRILDRILTHFYAITGLALALLFLSNQVNAITLMKVQALALLNIANALHGITT